MCSKRILGIVACCFMIGIQTSDAQFLKKLKDAAKKEVNKVADGLTKKKKTKSNEDTSLEEETKKEERVKLGQISTKEIPQGLSFDAPNESFRSFSVQEHNGLPRFGVLDSYGSGSKTKLPWGYTTYTDILLLKYGDILNLPLILNTTSSETFLKYFCNDERGDCNDQNRNAILNSPNLRSRGGVARNWGGYGANQFEKERKKNDFMEKHAPTLVDWSKTFWKDDTQMAYNVSYVRLTSSNPYDFERKGYWVNNPLKSGPNLNSQRFVCRYFPINRYEKNPDNESIYVLLKMDESTAENLINEKTSVLYAVMKIKLSFTQVEEANREVNMRSKRVMFNYCHESPVVEFYKDEALTLKVGELSYEDEDIEFSNIPPLYMSKN